jgi:2-keto-3-deoxy-L-rhamnonate aldolase
MLEPETYVELAQHPNIVGCKMSGNPRSPISLLKQYILTGRFFRSHGDVSVHVQVTTDPRIDHANFRLYSGFAQQLGPIVLFGAAGVIDGLSAFYPRTVVRLQQLAEERPMEQATLDEIQKLQYAVSRAQNFIIQTGIIGIREGILRVTGMGSVEGGRLPLSGRLAKAVWEELETKYLVDVRDREALL